MLILVKIECKTGQYAYQDNEVSVREMKIEVSDRQIYALNIGDMANAMLQDAAGELMSKKIDAELVVEEVPSAP